jgi:transcriptional regulator with XRE-family HTH domain
MAKNIYSENNDLLLNLLHSIRIKAKLTQKELAILLNKPQSFISKYESGERRLDILELKQICNVIGLNLMDFVKILEDLLNETK